MRKECLLRGSVRQHAPCPSTRVPIIGDPVGEVVLRSISWFRVRISSPNIFLPRSAQPFLVMTDGAFVALVFVLSHLVDWLVSLISPLAYLPPAFTQNSGWRHLRAAGYPFDPPYSESRLDDEERAYFTDHAILYLTETVLNPANQDAQGSLYLACMYGSRHQYDEMILVLDKAAQIGPIVQTMKAEFRERPMMLILLGACGVDQSKIERLRETLNFPETTEQFFCNYILSVRSNSDKILKMQ
jgi:hypothetical protein